MNIVSRTQQHVLLDKMCLQVLNMYFIQRRFESATLITTKLQDATIQSCLVLLYCLFYYLCNVMIYDVIVYCELQL